MARPGATRSIPIPQIQGRGSLSPYSGKSLTTSGVITAVRNSPTRPGFFLQDIKGDGDAATSDAIWVSTARKPPSFTNGLAPGQRVEVSGVVSEADTFTTINAANEGIKLRGAPSEAALPDPVTLKMPATDAGRATYLEARESMLTALPNAMALGPTSRFHETTMVDESLHGPKRDTDGKNAPRHMTVSGVIGPRTQLTTGDRPSNVRGVLGFNFGDYVLMQTGNTFGEIKRGPLPPKMWGDIDADGEISESDLKMISSRSAKAASGPLDPADLNGDGKITRTDVKYARERMNRPTGEPSFTVATMNAENFFDNEDAPPPVDDDVKSSNEYQTKLAKLAGAIRGQLGAPDLISLQEVENPRVVDDLLARPELRAAGYKYVQLPTVGHRSINPTLLYRDKVVDVNSVHQLQKEVSIDESALAGDSVDAGGEVRETGPLFAREPLIIDTTITKDGRTADVTLAVNHLISKFSPGGTPTDPIRIQQAKVLNAFVRDHQQTHPDKEMIVIGDMNDTPTSKALKALRGTGASAPLRDVLSGSVPAGERYSYNYHGRTELIDHILATPGLAQAVEGAGVHHFSADLPEALKWGTTPYRASDHDAPYVSFRLPAPPAENTPTTAKESAARS